VRSALEWAQARARAADGVSGREIARQLGVNRRTVTQMLESYRPPRYGRAPAGSMLDPLEPELRRLLADWPEIKAPRGTEILRPDYGSAGSVDLVRRRLRELRPVREAGAAHPLPRGPGAPAGLLELPTRCWGRSRTRARIGALRLRHDARVVPGGPRAGPRLARHRGARVRLRQPALGRRRARARRRALESEVPAPSGATTPSTPPPARPRRRP
jgi:transcriptional regulator with XRE-family HTH domain